MSGPFLTAEKLRLLVERVASRDGVAFTKAAEQTAVVLGVGRSTMFNYLENGVPTRASVGARQRLAALIEEMGE